MDLPPQGREEVLPAGVQGEPLPGAEEPVQVRRLLHEPPRAEGAPALDRRLARDLNISIERRNECIKKIIRSKY